MSGLNHWRRLIVVLAAMALATLPVPGWTETPTDEKLPKVVPVDTVTEPAPANDKRPSSRRKQPATAVTPAIAVTPIPVAAKAPTEPRLFQLDPNEPAHDILGIKAQVGPRIFDGTMFSRTAATEEIEEPSTDEIFARQIRALEAEQRRTTHMPGELKPATAWPDQNQSPEAAVLRQASWQLEQAAQMLEEHRLYKRADEVRQMASEMRKESRRPVESVGERVKSEPPTSISK